MVCETMEIDERQTAGFVEALNTVRDPAIARRRAVASHDRTNCDNTLPRQIANCIAVTTVDDPHRQMKHQIDNSRMSPLFIRRHA
jgi:hypothetical protein